MSFISLHDGPGLVYCGPRGLWHGPDGTYIVQMVKMVRNEDGTLSKFVLRKDGEWYPYDPDFVFGPSESFQTDLFPNLGFVVENESEEI